MAIDHKIIRNSENFKGLDIRSSDLARTMEYATDMKNAVYRKTGAISKRKGFKINLEDTDNFFGASNFRKINPSNGAVSDELLAVNTQLNRLIDEDFNIVYDGPSDVFVSLYITTEGKFTFEIKDQDSIIYEANLGTGLVVTDKDVLDLKQDINKIKFTAAILPNHTYVATRKNNQGQDLYTNGEYDPQTNELITGTDSNVYLKHIYDISSIPMTYIDGFGNEINIKETALKKGRSLKIGLEDSELEVIEYTANTNGDLISNIDITVIGNSFILNNFYYNGQEYLNTNQPLELREFHELTATVPVSVNDFKAALMDAVKDGRVLSSSRGGLNLSVKKWEEVDNGDASVNTTFNWQLDNASVLNTDEVENANFAQINDVMYISNGYDDIMKYDGRYVYKAGLPNCDSSNFSITQTSDNTNYLHNNKAKSVLSGYPDTNFPYGADLDVTVSPTSINKGVYALTTDDNTTRTSDVEVTVTPSGGSGSGLQVLIKTSSVGIVSDIIIITPGTNYKAGDTLTVNNGTLGGGDLTIEVTSITPACTGVGASVKIETDDQGYITNMDIVDGGSGYNKNDIVYVPSSQLSASGEGALLLTVSEVTAQYDFRTFEYRMVYEYTDNLGNIITSQPSDPIVKIVNPKEKIEISFTNISTSLAGRDLQGVFSTDHINFDSLDPLPGTITDFLKKYQTEKRLRVLIYRSKGYNPKEPDLEVVGQYYKIADLPYDHTSTFIDYKKDDDLNTFLALVDPIKRHDPPPKGKYLAVFKNCLVSAGDIFNVNNVRYSLPKNASTGEIGSEYFPDDDNGVIVDSPFGDKITAIAPLRNLLYVFHRNSVNVMGGQINLLEQPIVQLLTREGGVGCLSQQSIDELQNQLIFLSEQGIYSIDASNSLTEVSSFIAPLFKDEYLIKKRAVTVNWTNENLLIFQIPKESVNNTIYTTLESLVVVYDYYKKAWLKWTNIDMSAGAVLYKNNLSFISRGFDRSFLKTMNNTGSTYDFADHDDPIEFEYETNWESLGEPTIPKKFLRIKMYAFDTDGTFETPGFQIDAYVERNYTPFEVGVINFDFGRLAASGWGNEPWGEFRWGSVAASFIKSKLMGGKTKCLKLNFKNNTLNENILITNYELEIAMPYRQEIKD